MIYTHVSNKNISKVKSPLDNLSFDKKSCLLDFLLFYLQRLYKQVVHFSTEIVVTN